jgi:hypothetical protein
VNQIMTLLPPPDATIWFTGGRINRSS